MSHHDQNHDHDHDHEHEEFDTIILTDDEGQDHEFVHLDTLEVDGAVYFVLLPVNEEDSDDEEVADEAIILKLGKDEEGNEVLLDIEDDEEWEKVADAWEALVETEE